jgi:hypothetical protein
MESFLPLPRPAGRAPSRRAAASLAVQFQMLTLEDRVVPSSSIQLSGTGWKPIGPGVITDSSPAVAGLTSAGRINAIAHAPVPFDPNNPGYTGPTDPADPTYAAWNTYYVATPGGGVAKTIDGGLNWQFLTDNLPVSAWGNVEQNRNLHIGAIGVSPLNANLVFAGTGEVRAAPYGYAGTGLLHSTDGGVSWSLNKGPNNAFDGTAFAKFVFHPTNPNVIYAVVDGTATRYADNRPSAVYRTTDGGNTWENITVNTGASQFAGVTDFILDPTAPNVGYVAIENYGVVRSANLQVGTGPGATFTAPTDINYAITLGGTGTQLGGGTYGQIRLAFGLGTPSQPSRIYALSTSAGSLTSTQLFRSDDSGINFRRLDPFPGLGNSKATQITPTLGTYNLELVADPTAPNRLYFGGRGAGSVQVLTNADYNPDDPNQTPNYVNLTVPQGAGDAFNTVRNLVFDDTGVKDVNGRALTPGRLLLATDQGVYRLQAPNGGVTTNANFLGSNLDFVDLNGLVGTNALAAQQVFATGLPPRDDNRAIVGSYMNGTSIFQDTGPIAQTDPLFQKLLGQEQAAGTEGNGGETVFNALNPLAAFRVTNHSNLPEFGTFTYETTSGGLFQRSIDGGQSWTTSVGGIVNPGTTAREVAFNIDPGLQVGTTAARLYLGTDVVNVSTNDGQSWSQFGPNLPFVTGARLQNYARQPRITAVSNSRFSQLPIYVAVDYRTNGTVAEGAALYRWDGGPAWTDVSPGALIRILPPTNGAPGAPQPNDFSVANGGDSDPFDPFDANGNITDIAVDPTNSSIVYIVRDSLGTAGVAPGAHRIYRTTNGGFTWTDITGNLPASAGAADGLRVYSIALDPNRTNINPNNPNDTVNQTDDDVYIGTSLGVWKLTDPVNSTTWTRIGGTGGGAAATGTVAVAGQLPDVMVRDVKLNTTTGVLAASTFGRGVWQIQIRPYIRGLVFDDRTGNGTFDFAVPGVPPAPDTPGDKIFPGAVVVANDIVPNPPVQFANTTTANNGEYVFRSLPTSTYSFLPADASTKYVDTASRYYFTSNPIIAALNATSTVNGQDLYLFRRVSISGQVYEDANGDGVFQPTENPAVGYAVQLVAPAGTLNPTATVLATVTTDVNGNYTFLGVGPLRDAAVGPATPFASGYQVVLSKLNYQSTETPATTGVLISGVNLTDAANQNQTRIGAFRLGQLSGKIFEDGNGDGALNNAEAGLGGVTVNAIDLATNKLVATTVSAGDGSYLFGDLLTTLRAGTYTIQVVDKAGFVRTTPQFNPIAVQSGTKSTGLNIGLFAAASIFGNAFEDVNANGVRDPGETNPFPNVTISLVDPRTNGVVASAVTDGNGNYAFGGLFPLDLNGNKTPYLVRLTSPADFLAETVFDPVVTLSSGSLKFADLPLFVRTSVTGFAFEDINGNGFRDVGEPGLAGGFVSLLNANTGAVAYTTQTDGGGTYTFTGVGPIVGSVPYRVGANPAGAVQTTPNPPDFLVTSGTPVNVTVPIGLFRLSTFSGNLFDDTNGNGVRDNGEFPLPGRVVQLVDANSGAVVATTATDGNGDYSLSAGAGTFFVRLAATGGFAQTTPNAATVTTTSGLAVTGQNFGLFQLTTVTGFVYNDLNGNSIRDAEPGLGNVLVELVNSATATVVASTTTDGTGFFTIPGVGPGSYTVRAALGGGLVASTPAVQSFTAASGTPTTFSFGAFFPTTVSGFVYEDLNRSNGFNAGDIASAGWTVQVTRPGGILAGTALTDASGNVSFGNLAPGSYTARVLNRQGFAVLNNGTQTISVVSGTPVTLAPVGVLKLGSLSGSLFLDSNRNGRFDGFERGLAGGTVQLIDGNGRVAATATTDDAGFYTFLGLQTGSYSVRLAAAPPGFALSPTGATTLTATTTVGSPNPDNAVTGLNFGLVGRRRYALAADGGGGPRVQVYDAQSNALLNDFFVYEVQFTGGVRVAEADVNGDGVDDLIVVPGKGGGPRVRVLSGADGSELYNYFAYEPSFTDGLYVTAGDVDGDGYADIITGTDSGGGPRVTVFSGKTGVIIADYFAYDSSFRGGVRVGSADTDGNGVSEILTAPGVGGGPTVKVFGGGDFRELASFNAFAPDYTGGVFLAASAANLTTGRGDIVVGSGIDYPTAPVVRVFNGQTFDLQSEFEAFPGDYRSEVRVTSLDRNGDGVPDIAVASGAGTPSRLRFVDGLNFRQLGDEIQPYETAFLGGIFIG